MKKWIGILVAAGAVLICVHASSYTISEVEQVIITQFGEPIGEPINSEKVPDPGLHFKLPFVQKVNRFEKRWLEWDGDAAEMPTKEKTYIWVDTYARWRIADALQFFRSVGNERGAQSRLDDIIDAEVRNVIAAYELKEVVRLTNRKLPQAAYETEGAEKEEAQPDPSKEKEVDAVEEPEDVVVIDEGIVMGREKLTRLVLEKAQKAMPDFGIELVDIQFQRVNYTKSVEEKVFQRMVSERKRIAQLYRSQGKGAAADIRGNMKQELREIQSEATKTAEIIMGKADAEATAIYAAAHNLDPDLYRLLKSLESYKKSIDENTWLILSTDTDYFQALKSMR